MAANGSTYDTGLQFVQWAESGQEDSVENIIGNDRSSAKSAGVQAPIIRLLWNGHLTLEVNERQH